MKYHGSYHTGKTGDSARASLTPKGSFRRSITRIVLCLTLGIIAVAWAQTAPPAPPVSPPPGGSTDPALSPLDQRLQDLSQKLEEAILKDPESPEVKALQEQIDQTFEQMQRQMEASIEKEAKEAALAPESLPPAPANEPATSPEELRLHELTQKLEQAMQADPESAEAKALQQQLEQTVDQLRKRMESQKGTSPWQLPGKKPTPRRKPSSRIHPATSAASPVNEKTPPTSVAATGSEVTAEAAPESPATTEAAPEDTAPAETPKASTKMPVISPDAVVKLRINNDMLDVGYLLEFVGKELGLTFLYDTAQGMSGSVKFQQFGDIRHRDLLPLLESVLRFQGFSMVREGAFIRIVQRAESTKKAEPPLRIGEEASPVETGDTVVVQIVSIKHTNPGDMLSLLSQFVSDPTAIVPISNSNFLVITEYAKRIPRILEIINHIDQPGPERKLDPIEVKNIDARDAAEKLSALIRDLGEQMASVAPATQGQTPRRSRRNRNQPNNPQPPQPPPGMPSQNMPGQPQGPMFHVDERTNRILVIGTEDQIAQARQLLSLLDVTFPGAEIRIIPFKITYVMAGDIAQQVVSLLEAITKQTEYTPGSPQSGDMPPQQQPGGQYHQQGRRSSQMNNQSQLLQAGEDGPFVLADERTNRLIVVGKDSQITQIEDLLSLLDIESLDLSKGKIVTYQLQFVEAAETLKILDQLGVTKSEQRQSARDRASRGGGQQMNRPGEPMGMDAQGIPDEEDFEIKAAAQDSTNRLFILGTDPQHRMIANVIKEIDIEPDKNKGAIQIYWLENRDPKDVATMLKDLLESDKFDNDKKVNIPGKEGAPVVVALEDIYAIAVRGSAKQHTDIKEIIKALDKRLPQVLVEAILVQVKDDSSLKLGVGLQNKWTGPGNNNTTSAQSPFALSDSGSLSKPGTSGTVAGTGATIAFFNNDLVKASLETLATEQKGKVTSMPRILVNDNEEGSIDSKDSRPTTKTTYSGSTSTTSTGGTTGGFASTDFAGYQDAGTTLKITPHISEGDFLKLEIELDVDNFVGESPATNIPPAKVTNKIKTIVTVPNDNTIVLGGLTTENKGNNIRKIPLLGDIPLIGSLFRNVNNSGNKNVLYVFVRANIVRSNEGNFEDMNELSEKYRSGLRKMEQNQEELPIIPGIVPKKKQVKSVLDENY